MKILIIGSGGREHALGWKVKQSPLVKKIFFAPGNGGTVAIGKNIDIKVHEIDKLLAFAIERKIDFTIVGPEEPLSLGIVDLFENKKQRIFGPTKLAARLESSKAWSSNFMKKYAIPQPTFYIFKNFSKAISFFEKYDPSQFVIKASGLAMGKGVLLPKTKKEAQEAIRHMMVDKEFGNAGSEIVIQEKLIGQEVSVIALSDGTTVIPFLPAQDYKRVFNNDEGPNTGGMGAYAPTPFITKELMEEIQKTILVPTIKGMKSEGCLYKGILYAGLMITKDGPKVLEFNVRFGDPETQPLMALLKSDILPLLLAGATGTLENKKMRFHHKTAVCVVLASNGYPGTYEKGQIIHGLGKKYGRKINIFHAGTAIKEGKIFTNGGRVLGITAWGGNFKRSVKNVYSAIGKKGIFFKKMYYRSDIGAKAVINLE